MGENPSRRLRVVVGRLVRSAAAVAVGGGVVVLVAVVSAVELPLALATFLVYGGTAALALGNRPTIRRIVALDVDPSPTLGAIGAGVSGFACVALALESVPVGVTALGLLLFGALLVFAALADVADGG